MLHIRKTWQKVLFYLLIAGIIMFLWSSVNIFLATKTVNAQLKGLKIGEKTITNKTLNDGCQTVKQEFGTYTGCTVTGMEAYISSDNYRAKIQSVDEQIRAHGWLAGDNNASELAKLNDNLFTPISVNYISTNKDSLILFSSKKYQKPGGDILNINVANSHLSSVNQFVYGIQIVHAYPTLPSNFLPNFSFTSRDIFPDTNGQGFITYLPTEIPSGYHKEGGNVTSQSSNNSGWQAFTNAKGQEFHFTESHYSGDPLWITTCSSTPDPRTSCQTIGTTTSGEKVQRAIYNTPLNRQWKIVHADTAIVLGGGIGLTDDDVMKMFNSLR